jgi:hypothetical protein
MIGDEYPSGAIESEDRSPSFRIFLARPLTFSRITFLVLPSRRIYFAYLIVGEFDIIG